VEVMKMWFLILFVLIVIAICAVAVWTQPDGSPIGQRRAEAAGETAASSSAHPESLEGVLVAQLLAGEISRGQYLRAIEGLAARDDDRHPLTVPPETGSADV
jgi:hypothetical protein